MSFLLLVPHDKSNKLSLHLDFDTALDLHVFLNFYFEGPLGTKLFLNFYEPLSQSRHWKSE